MTSVASSVAASITSALPSATSQPQTTSWHSEPRTRGTWNLLFTCLVTINLCVWTAVHLNIPAAVPQPDNRPLRIRIWRNYYCRRARWLLLGLLAPELVVYTAWVQWMSAGLVVHRINKAIDEAREESLSSEDADGNLRLKEMEKIKMTQGFYAGMGGFCFESHPDEAARKQRAVSPPALEPTPLYKSIIKDFAQNDARGCAAKSSSENLPYEPSPLYLSMMHDFSRTCPEKQNPAHRYLAANAVVELIVDGKLSLPSKDLINDRSKSDLLAKTLVCVQAGYMIFQVIGRVTNSLPITLLELNTLGHVICALVMYGFWYNKPQGIHQSSYIDGDLSKYLRAWDETVRKIYLPLDESELYLSNEDLRFIYFAKLYKHVWSWEKDHRREHENRNGVSAEHDVLEGLPKEGLSDIPGLVFVDEANLLSNEWIRERLLNSRVWDSFTSVYHSSDLDGSSIETHYLISKQTLLLFEPLIEYLLESKISPPWSDLYVNAINTHLYDEIQNWPDNGLLSGGSGVSNALFSITLSTALYGGLHAAAWDTFFPTDVEKWMWRISSMIITASGLAFAIGKLNDRWYDMADRSLFSYEIHKRQPPFHLRVTHNIFDVLKLDIEEFNYYRRYSPVKFAIICALGSLSFVARLYLVVESFVSLREVPLEVYQTPNWTQWLPHL